MRLSQWVTLIAILVGLGCLQVSSRNAIFLKGYALGERIDQMHTQETDLSWLHASVVGLESPTHLARVAGNRGMKFEARKTVSATPVPANAPIQLAIGDLTDER